MNTVLQTAYRELYERYWSKLEPYLRGRPELSHPLLVSPPDGYAIQERRLFVVGQQTKCWAKHLSCSEGTVTIDSLLDHYTMWLGNPNKGKRIFWTFVTSLEGRLGIQHNQLIWSNLNKVDQKEKCPQPEVVKELQKLFPVLAEEIKLAEPHFVLFLTGPDFDENLKAVFPEAVIKDDEKLPKWIASVQHQLIPCKAFRTYHPNHMRFKRGHREQVLGRLQESCQAGNPYAPAVRRTIPGGAATGQLQ